MFARHASFVVILFSGIANVSALTAHAAEPAPTPADAATIEALKEVDGAGMAKLGLWGFPGTKKLNERALALFHTDYDHLVAVVFNAAKGADAKTAARVRCHVRQTEAVDLLMQAEQRRDRLEVDAHGNVEVSALVPQMRSEGLEDERGYTLERRENADEIVFIARGVGEMQGDVWVRHLPKAADWMRLMFAPITIAKDILPSTGTHVDGRLP